MWENLVKYLRHRSFASKDQIAYYLVFLALDNGLTGESCNKPKLIIKSLKNHTDHTRL